MSFEKDFSVRPTKQYMVTTGIDQSLSNCAMYGHRCLENIKKLYTFSVKCNDQLQFKEIIEGSIVYTTEIFTDNSPMSIGTSIIIKKFSARKSLRLFTEFLNVKKLLSAR